MISSSFSTVPRHGESNGWHRRSDRHEDLQPMHPKVMAVAESAFSSEAEVSVAATASASAPTRAAKEAEEAHKKRRVEVEVDELEDERSKETDESYQGDQGMGPTAGVLRKTEDAGPTLGAQPKQLWFSNFEEFQRLTEPAFDNNTVSNVTVQLGGTAFLHCRVRNLGERTVSGAEVRITSILSSLNICLAGPRLLFRLRDSQAHYTNGVSRCDTMNEHWIDYTLTTSKEYVDS
ncbi:hypothetical protein J437_LFUL000487 [Ladona fulva]|uniref:Ig-like domain-containing protein n=1 Tax=Ladona fulva TaxID=123851 RepID=A0A8K0KIX8_LADFU|nr:hypothetical protein J437_LFUL000487 [Ladona fulva]